MTTVLNTNKVICLCSRKIKKKNHNKNGRRRTHKEKQSLEEEGYLQKKVTNISWHRIWYWSFLLIIYSMLIFVQVYLTLPNVSMCLKRWRPHFPSPSVGQTDLWARSKKVILLLLPVTDFRTGSEPIWINDPWDKHCWVGFLVIKENHRKKDS